MALASSAQLLAFPDPRISLRAALMPQLKQHRLPEHLIESIIREASLVPPCGIDEALGQVLARRMRLQPLDFGATPHLFLVGPSGAGVKSVAAKLRHRAATEHMAVAIEESSFNPLNRRARAAFGSVNERQGVEIIGVVSALADAEAVSETIAAFKLGRVIVTGLDMASRLGAVTAAVTQGARLAGITRSPQTKAGLEMLSAGQLAVLLLS